jgi:hypothetical protein
MDDKDQPTDPSAIIIPFGKHKGKTVSELLAVDQPYADWMTAQGWVAERFAELHAAIVTRGAGSDDTPEHNALQARFLEPAFLLAFLAIVRPQAAGNDLQKYIEERRSGLQWLIDRWDHQNDRARNEALLARATPESHSMATKVEFEYKGVDVFLQWAFHHQDRPAGFDYDRAAGRVAIELKPTIGDDYPTVMRQMHRLGAKVLVIGQYTGRGVSEPQLRQMFNASGFDVVFVQEIEERLRAIPASV